MSLDPTTILSGKIKSRIASPSLKNSGLDTTENLFLLFFFLSFKTYAIQELKGAWFECEFSGKTSKPTDDCKMLDNDGFIFNKNVATHISFIDSQEHNCKKNTLIKLS